MGSMYGIFIYMYHRNQGNVGKYSIHGSYGLYIIVYDHICKNFGSSIQDNNDVHVFFLRCLWTCRKVSLIDEIESPFH